MGYTRKCKGTWVDDEMTGYGECVDTFYDDAVGKELTSTIKGQFIHSQLEGQGTEVSHDGTYTGNFIAGVKSGFGKKVFKDGRIYEGDWKDGQPNGQGTMTLANKTVLKGKFINGEYQKPFNCNKATIGTQVWMAENLSVSRFRNGDEIPEAKSAQEWYEANKNYQPAWCYYNNDPENGRKYGKLYNYAALIDARGLAPEGWHVASSAEWKILSNTLGGNSKSGEKLKSTFGWNANGNGTNSSGFNALPGGFRYRVGDFSNIGNQGQWGTSASGDYSGTSLVIELNCNFGSFNTGSFDNGTGFSVRCVKD